MLGSVGVYWGVDMALALRTMMIHSRRSGSEQELWLIQKKDMQ